MQTADLLPRMIENPLDDALVRQLYPHYGDLPLPVIKEKFESPDGYLSYLQMNGCKADILSIAKSLMPFACSEKGYQKIQAMDCDTYVIKSPNEMMSFSQVAIIAQVASSIISTKKGFLNLYIKRKQLGIPLKLIFPAGNTCFIVLHKKNDRQDITGRDKRGRAALLCEVKEHIWSTKKIWNLTTIKGHSSLFYNARTIENTLVAAIRKPIFTKRLFDFDISNATYSKRSCYYPKYRSLFDCWIRNEYSENTMRLQRVLLNASKAICDLHEAGYVSGDLKEDNLLVDEMDAVILCDLDRVTAYKDSEKHFEYHTSDYAPPEAFTTEPKDGKKYDVFAFGCIMYSLVCNRMPVWFYKKKGSRNLYESALGQYSMIAEKARYKLIDPEKKSIRELIIYLAFAALDPLPSKRPSMKEIHDLLLNRYPKKEMVDMEELIAMYESIENCAKPPSFCDSCTII